jgi:hypothetical protein
MKHSFSSFSVQTQKNLPYQMSSEALFWCILGKNTEVLTAHVI